MSYYSILDVHGVVCDGLRRNFLPPVWRLRGNRNHVTFGQVVGLPALNARGATLIGAGLPGADQGPASYQRRLAFDDDEDVVGLLMRLNLAGAAALGQDDQALVVDYRSAFGHRG